MHVIKVLVILVRKTYFIYYISHKPESCMFIFPQCELILHNILTVRNEDKIIMVLRKHKSTLSGAQTSS